MLTSKAHLSYWGWTLLKSGLFVMSLMDTFADCLVFTGQSSLKPQCSQPRLTVWTGLIYCKLSITQPIDTHVICLLLGLVYSSRSKSGRQRFWSSHCGTFCTGIQKQIQGKGVPPAPSLNCFLNISNFVLSAQSHPLKPIMILRWHRKPDTVYSRKLDPLSSGGFVGVTPGYMQACLAVAPVYSIEHLHQAYSTKNFLRPQIRINSPSQPKNSTNVLFCYGFATLIFWFIHCPSSYVSLWCAIFRWMHTKTLKHMCG